LTMAASRNPKDLIFTLFGEYLLAGREGPVWVGSLIELLEPLDVREAAVRTALSRMSGRGWLASERRGRNAFYVLTDRGRKLLEEGERRLYRPRWDEAWDGIWRLVHYSIPEEDRPLRDRLRLRLSWLGLGSLGNGLWITPLDILDRVEDVVRELELDDGVELFEGCHPGMGDDEALVGKCWDLPAIHDRYVEFIDRHLPRFARFRKERAEGKLSEEEAYVHRFDLVHEYREFPLIDPYLPPELRPDDWAGDCAAGLFRALHDLLEEPAELHVDRVLSRVEEGVDSTTEVDDVVAAGGGKS